MNLIVKIMRMSVHAPKISSKLHGVADPPVTMLQIPFQKEILLVQITVLPFVRQD